MDEQTTLPVESTTPPDAEPNEVSLLAVRAKDDPTLMAELWEAVQRLIKLWAYKYARRYHEQGTRLFDVDDLVQAGYLALVKAVAEHDPLLGDAFIIRLHNRALTQFNIIAARSGGKYRKKDRPECHATSLDLPLTKDTDTTRADQLADPNAEFADNIIEQEALLQDCAALLTEIEKLPEEQRRVLMLTGWDGLTLRAAAEVMGVSFNDARRHKRAAVEYVRNSKAGRCIYQERFSRRIRHVTLTEFKTTWTSSVEWSVLFG